MKKYELIYSKCHEARFLSHLDLLRGTQRAFRRSGLPIEYTSGFNPRPKISFMTFPLPVGFSGDGERLEFTLTEGAEENEVLAALAESFPPGLVPLAVRAAGGGAPEGVGCCFSFLIFIAFAEGAGAPPEVIQFGDGRDAAKIPWDAVDERRIFAGPPAPGHSLRELYDAAWLLGPLCADVTVRPDKILAERFDNIRSLYVHRTSG